MIKVKKTVIPVIIGGLAGSITGMLFMNKKIENKSKKVDKFKSYYNMLNQWISLKQEGKTLEEYFVNNGYKNVAIYGMGEMGNRLYDELKNSNIKVKYAVDENAEGIYSEIEVFSKKEEYPDVDVIIVTAIFEFDSIKKELQKKIKFPVIALDDVVYEV